MSNNSGGPHRGFNSYGMSIPAGVQAVVGLGQNTMMEGTPLTQTTHQSARGFNPMVYAGSMPGASAYPSPHPPTPVGSQSSQSSIGSQDHIPTTPLHKRPRLDGEALNGGAGMERLTASSLSTFSIGQAQPSISFSADRLEHVEMGLVNVNNRLQFIVDEQARCNQVLMQRIMELEKYIQTLSTSTRDSNAGTTVSDTAVAVSQTGSQPYNKAVVVSRYHNSQSSKS